ncbi:hypothetical protein UCDDA912_g03670 [Diaporthe ampelina]|uniref:Uncharacterized protein n=1 Tax=Diaporthe ampelina TaxID=1214573 RepID=A0A0G2FQR7_9PEZI|nr:hypothetical protein UCDDA912_g03670 [Diaporthe ampelina]
MGRVKTGKIPPGNIATGLSVRARRKAGHARTAYHMQKRISQIVKGLRNLPIDPLERLDALIPRAGLVRDSCPMWVSSPDKAQALCQALQKDGPDARDVTPMLMDFLDHVERHFSLPASDLQLEHGTPADPQPPCHDRLNPPLRVHCWEHIIADSSLPTDLPVVIAKELMESLDVAHSRFIRKRNKSIAKKRARAAAGHASQAAVKLDQALEQMMPKSPFAKRLVRVHSLLHTPWQELGPRRYTEYNGDDVNEDPDLREDADQEMEIDEDEEGYDLKNNDDDDDENSSNNGSFMFQEDWEDDERDMGDHNLLLGASARPIADFAQNSRTRRPFGDLAQLLSSAPSADQKVDVSRVDFQGSTVSIAFGAPTRAERTTK